MAKNRGFVLIEALVATAILSGIGASVVFLLDTHRTMNARAASQLRQVSSAEAILDRVGLDVPLQVQHLSGRLRDGSAWMIDIIPFEEPDLPADSRRSGVFKVTVEVSPQRGQGVPVKLQTLRVADVAP
jgi:type II secretory pathway pseudopilin PulG